MDGFDETYARPRARSSSKKDEKKPDWLVRLSAAQLVLAVLGVALLLIISKVSPDTFVSLRAQFKEIMSTDMSASDVFGAFGSLVGGGEPTSESGIAESTTEVQTEEMTEETTEETSEAEQKFAAGGDDLEIYEATSAVCFAPFSSTVPLALPVSGEITSRFGYRYHPITGEFGIHNGTDISAPEGTPVAAAFNGVVKETGYNSVRGNYILLSHGAGTKTLYLHCSEIIAPEGAVIRQGEIIAKVGSTGWSTGPHLHFSVIVNGKYCNPEWLF